jgi:hypothetical protein
MTTTSHSFLIGPKISFNSGDYTQANYILRAIATYSASAYQIRELDVRFGRKQIFRIAIAMSALPPKVDIGSATPALFFTSDNDNYRSFPAIRLFSVDPLRADTLPSYNRYATQKLANLRIVRMLSRHQMFPRLEHDLSSQEDPCVVAPSDKLRDPYDCCRFGQCSTMADQSN